MNNLLASWGEIPAINPVIISATKERKYPHLFVTNLLLHTYKDKSQSVDIELQAYNYATGELSTRKEDIIQHNIEDLYAEATRAPLVATVINNLAYLVSLLTQEKGLIEAIQEAETCGESTKDLEVRLQNIHQQLGIKE